jgi:hypothetical protein
MLAKIRGIQFTVDQKMIVINNKTKLGYYTRDTLNCISESDSGTVSEKKTTKLEGEDLSLDELRKSTEGDDAIRNELDTGLAPKKSVEALNYFESTELNIMKQQPMVKNFIGCVCLLKDDNSTHYPL